MKLALLLLLSLTCAVKSQAQSDSTRRTPGGDSLRRAVDSEVIFRGRDRQRRNSIRVNGVELVDPLTGRIGSQTDSNSLSRRDSIVRLTPDGNNNADFLFKNEPRSHGSRGTSDSALKLGFEIVDPLTGKTGSLQENIGRLAISETEITTNDSGRPKTRMIWVPRDSTNIWKHDGPDTGMIQLVTQPWGYYTGRLVSHDANWVTIVTESGLKQEIETSRVKGVMDLKMVADTTNTARLRFQKTDAVWSRPHLLAYFAPTVLAGITLPTGGDMTERTAGLSSTTMALFGFRVPGVLYNYLGEFLGVSYESRSFSIGQESWSANYLALSAGFSLRGLISAGVTLGLPISAEKRTYSSAPQGMTAPIRSSFVHTLIEPKLILGYPIVHEPNGHALMLLASLGYPLSPIFDDFLIVSFPSAEQHVNGVHLPEISLGLSYVLPLFNPYYGLRME